MALQPVCMKFEISEKFKVLQKQIIDALEELDGQGRFGTEEWERLEGGGGITRLLTQGRVIEKGGVNFSAVHGPVPQVLKANFGLTGASFYATGVSIVIHPVNPFVPIIHMNVRYFELSDGTCWFGGGIDLTPCYVIEEDANFFHTELKRVCDKFDLTYYPAFKERADDYFFIPHREEMRGIGGIFFDRLKPNSDKSIDHLWEFTYAVGECFAPTYTTIARRRSGLPFTEKEKNWQLHRRSRYVEFNLVYDAGTKFGLESGGRIESILMSMPPLAAWNPENYPKPGTPEWESTRFFQKGHNWVFLSSGK